MTTPILEVAGVTKSFGVTVVDKLSFSVQAGDAVGIVGPNGAGKTTLLNLTAGDLACDSGTITHEGVDITSMATELRCRRGLARTSQIPRPFEGMTVFENVLAAAVFVNSSMC